MDDMLRAMAGMTRRYAESLLELADQAAKPEPEPAGTVYVLLMNAAVLGTFKSPAGARYEADAYMEATKGFGWAEVMGSTLGAHLWMARDGSSYLSIQRHRIR
jgi:hypothetical protein